MTLESLAALMLASFLAKAIPGPGVFATVAHALALGFRPSLVFVAGIMTGDSIYILAAMFGMVALANSFHDIFNLIRIIGGVYLLYLGYRLLTTRIEQSETPEIHPKNTQRTYLSGFFLTLGNPKTILFYIGLMPAFIDLGALEGSEMALLWLLLNIDLLLILGAYAYASDRARGFFKSPRAMQRLNRGAGLALAGTGVAVIART